VSAANSSPRGINPRRQWQYERDDAFNRAAESCVEMLVIAAGCYGAALLLALVLGGCGGLILKDDPHVGKTQEALAVQPGTVGVWVRSDEIEVRCA
jgi:hypothetical protein